MGEDAKKESKFKVGDRVADVRKNRYGIVIGIEPNPQWYKVGSIGQPRVEWTAHEYHLKTMGEAPKKEV